ncbi:hypothetical protein A3K88_13970 [Pseudomonas putida]|nr:hypothetical protein A3K88_13970 [Pseudomonas putida]
MSHQSLHIETIVSNTANVITDRHIHLMVGRRLIMMKSKSTNLVQNYWMIAGAAWIPSDDHMA